MGSKFNANNGVIFLPHLCSSFISNVFFLFHPFFASKQHGPEAEKANNVYYHLSYYDSEDLDKVEDKTLRAEIELHIADFGNCPSQLFFKPHSNKKAESLAIQSKVRKSS